MKKLYTYLLIAVCFIAGNYIYQHSLGQSANEHTLKDVIVIDKSLENYEELVSSSEGKGRIILVDNSDQGFARLKDDLRSLRSVKNLHILTHGTSGNLVLGRQQLNESNLEEFKGFWQSIRNSFASSKSELLIYSCQLAEGRSGKSFVDKLHKVLGVSVAGSDDNTGAERRGGNWILEYVAGDIIKENILNLVKFSGLLIPSYTEFAGTNSPFDAMKIDADNQLICGDFDADGDIDVHLYPGNLLDNEFWQNNGSGTFTKVAGNLSPFRNMTWKIR